MRGLALARLRYMTRRRAASGTAAVSLLLAAFQVVVGGQPFIPASELWTVVEPLMFDRARVGSGAYLWHLIVLIVACDLFGMPPALYGGRRPADLTETAPISPARRFLGDALGIFQCVAVVHLCTLPLLAVGFVLSPLRTAMFFLLEGAVLLTLIFGSSAAAWNLRSVGKWRRTRLARSMVLFFIVFLTIVISTTDWGRFRDAALSSIFEPAPWHWTTARAAIKSPPAFFGLLFALYAGFVIYYFVSSIRNREEVHGL